MCSVACEHHVSNVVSNVLCEMATYNTRKALRRSLLEKEFADEYSLSPTMLRESVNYGPSSEIMLNQVTLKREHTTARNSELADARARTAALDPEKLLQDAFKTSSYEAVNAEYEVFMERYRRGDHILRNVAKEQNNDADLLYKYHHNAADVLSQSLPLKNAPRGWIGPLLLPPVTTEEKRSLKARKAAVKDMSSRLSLHKKTQDSKARVRELHDLIHHREAEIAELTVRIERNHQDDNFDWLLEMHNKIRTLTALVTVDKEDVEQAEQVVIQCEDEMRRRYPDMSAQVSMGILDSATDTHASFSRSGDRDIAQMNLTKLNAQGERVGLVYAWVIGRLTDKGDVTHLLFGQFTESSDPPKGGWIFIGKTIALDHDIPDTQAGGTQSIVPRDPATQTDRRNEQEGSPTSPPIVMEEEGNQQKSNTGN
jgi:hypothetical protein